MQYKTQFSRTKKEFLIFMYNKTRITLSFKTGFKNNRKKMGITQKEFAEKYSDIASSIVTVQNWEQGRNIPRSEKDLENLCNVFQCDLDSLFGNIDCSTHDIQFIHDKTGLSEDAIKMLMLLNEQADKPDTIRNENESNLKMLNLILETAYKEIAGTNTKSYSTILKDMFEYLNSSNVFSYDYNGEPTDHLYVENKNGMNLPLNVTNLYRQMKLKDITDKLDTLSKGSQ